MNLYLFDFDGTLYKGDSMIDYLKIVHKSKIKYYSINLKFVPYWVLKFLGIINKDKYKTCFLKMHFKDYNDLYLSNCSNEFSKVFHENLYPGVIDYLESLNGEKSIVTASVDIWMKNIAKELNLTLISTKSVFENRRFLKIERNCNYDEKLRRIKEKYNLGHFKEIFVFGNSKGDYKMYELGKKNHKYFI